MNDAYTATVRQLLDIAPVVFESPNFAIKGGTALNLFLHDLPRLSVDIDVVFTDHTLDRATALQAISCELRVISQKLEAMGYEVLLHRNSANNESKLKVLGPLAEVKVEVNEVFRGTLLPLQQRPLSPATEEEFAQAVTLPLLATAELYGSKLVAAMDRQHPRDLFDVHVLYNDTGLTPEIVDCFVAYLAGVAEHRLAGFWATKGGGGAHAHQFIIRALEPIAQAADQAGQVCTWGWISR